MIGRGGEGFIKKCRVDGRDGAAKFLQDNCPENVELLINEVEVMW